MEDPAAKLVDELRSLLDATTILSISSDYNLQDPEEFAAARQVLLTISKDVEAEEASGFNPSGFGSDGVFENNPSKQDGNAEVAEVASSDMKSVSAFTTESSVSPSLVSSGSSKSSAHETPPDLIHVGIFDDLGDREKEENLIQMFVGLKPIDIKLALQKSKGDASLAIDELLNLQWLEQTGQRPKGIDGFYKSDDDIPNSKKKRGRKKRKAAKLSSVKTAVSENGPEEAGQNEVIQNDKVALIADRLNLSPSDVTSIYHRHNASLGATVMEVLNNYIDLGLQQTNPQLLSDIQQETANFPHVPTEYLKAVFEICPPRDEAVDIIHILADHFKKPIYLKYDVPYNIVASDPEAVAATYDLVPTSNLKPLPKPFAKVRSTVVSSHQEALSQSTNLQAAATVTKTLAESRNHSSSSATAAFKKGKSDPLFRQAGSYYADRAREQAASYRRASSIEANYLVDKQSTKNMIDLHGVTVQHGVDIALDRVWKWWDGLGEERARKAKDGFTVVTGIGRHNADGKSPLRVNVAKALIADGWKVEILTGSYFITGRR